MKMTYATIRGTLLEPIHTGIYIETDAVLVRVTTFPPPAGRR